LELNRRKNNAEAWSDPTRGEGVVAVAQRHLAGKAGGIGVGALALAALNAQSLHIAGGRQPRHPLVERVMRIGLADQDKAQPLLADGLTQRLLAVEVIAQDSDA